MAAHFEASVLASVLQYGVMVDFGLIVLCYDLRGSSTSRTKFCQIRKLTALTFLAVKYSLKEPGKSTLGRSVYGLYIASLEQPLFSDVILNFLRYGRSSR